MAVAVGACVGAKRGFNGEFEFSPPLNKRSRFNGVQGRFSTSPSGLAGAGGVGAELAGLRLAQLRALFPQMDPQTIAETLENVEHNVDAAIKLLEELQLSKNAAQAAAASAAAQQASEASTHHQRQPEGEGPPPAVDEAAPLAPLWVDGVVQEMAGATNLQEARDRAANLLHKFEAAVTEKASTQGQVAKENATLQVQVQALARDNTILKRAVAIQNARQQEHANREQEVAQLQQTIVQYQEQLRNAELHNYALSMHLRQATSSGADNTYNPRNPDIC
mmetsp:Transcript_37988/g.82604  ORF Transcript_37988/g.82604 Transcript_37988/m.82604 type:complete len:278 (-) Transcript_37988:410-1243(-)